MTPAEQQSIVADRQAREKADQEAMQAQIAADDEAAREREATGGARGRAARLLRHQRPAAARRSGRSGLLGRRLGLSGVLARAAPGCRPIPTDRSWVPATRSRGPRCGDGRDRSSSSRRLRHALSFVTSLVAISIAACSSPPSEPPAPTPSPVDEVVEAHLAARGGKEKLQSAQSIRETGTVTASDGRVARVVREIKRPGLFRLEFTYEGTKSVFAYDGEDGLAGGAALRPVRAGGDAAGGRRRGRSSSGDIESSARRLAREGPHRRAGRPRAAAERRGLQAEGALAGRRDALRLRRRRRRARSSAPT